MIMEIIIKKFVESKGYTYDDLLGSSRKSILPTLRKVISYELRCRLWEYKHIAKLLNRHYSTIIYETRSIDDLLHIKDKQIISLLEEFRFMLDNEC